jgi:hypothetical protein
MRKTCLIYLPKHIFSEVDAFAPVIAELGENHADEIDIDILWWSETSWQETSMSAYHVALFEEFTRSHHLYHRRNRFSKLRKLRGFSRLTTLLAMLLGLMRVLWLLAVRVLRYRRLVIVSGRRGTLDERLLRHMFEMVGTVLSFPGIQAPLLRPYLTRYNPDMQDAWEAFQGHRSAPYNAQDTGIHFVQETTQWLADHFGKDPDTYHLIGFPRLFLGWHKQCHSVGERVLQDILVERGLAGDTPEILTVLLTAPDYIWFREGESFFQHLDAVVFGLRSVFPDTPIFLKAKPRYLITGVEALRELDQRYTSVGQVYQCWTALSVLAIRTRVAVSIHETTGVFDFLAASVPVLEYGRYNDDWVGLVPGKSPWVGLPGFRLVETAAELDAQLRAVMDGEFVGAEPEALASAIGHRQDLSVFLD